MVTSPNGKATYPRCKDRHSPYVLSKGGVVEVQKFGVKMKGASLAGYVRKIGSRIAVLRCLQSQVSLGTTVKSVSLTGSERAAKITADQTEYITGQVAYEKGDYGTDLLSMSRMIIFGGWRS